jgi:hypothetical protein
MHESHAEILTISVLATAAENDHIVAPFHKPLPDFLDGCLETSISRRDTSCTYKRNSQD